jgi:hypothetical protein
MGDDDDGHFGGYNARQRDASVLSSVLRRTKKEEKSRRWCSNQDCSSPLSGTVRGLRYALM